LAANPTISGLLFFESISRFGWLTADVTARQHRSLIWASWMVAATGIYRAIKDSRNEIRPQYKSSDPERCLSHSIMETACHC
jgi:hypothetical protein